MKKSFFPSLVISFIFLFTAGLISCSKDKAALSPGGDNTTLSGDTNDRIANWGSVKGTVVPVDAKISVILYSEKYSFSNFYYEKDGSFRFDRVPVGIYTLEITNVLSGEKYVIEQVKVARGALINVGQIKLK